MSRNTCPRCGHQGLRKEAGQRATGNRTTHKTEVQECPNCGWKNI